MWWLSIPGSLVSLAPRNDDIRKIILPARKAQLPVPEPLLPEREQRGLS
jgi:hypothetical protein